MLFPSLNRSTNPRRVVVTGMGIITALGQGYRANAAGFRAGKTGFRPVRRFDVSRQRTQFAAEADVEAAEWREALGVRQRNRVDHAGELLLTAGWEAWRQGGWTPGEIPVVLGTTAGGMSLGEDYYRQAFAHPLRHQQQATRASFYQAQVQARLMTEALRVNGPITLISTACAAGANAVGHAWEMVRAGRTDRALAGGYEALCQLLFAGFDSLQALTTTTCRPFDTHRDGLALGEGAAILCLESLDSARNRRAEILGEIIGYGHTIDLHHLTQPQPQGHAACESMSRAARCASLEPSQVDYINAHGTGTPLNDSAEALGIAKWAGPHCQHLRVSSTKAGIGHLLGAAGAVESVISLMALRESFLPPELALQTPDPTCAFSLVSAPEDRRLNIIVSNSFGFGGVNASLVFKRFE